MCPCGRSVKRNFFLSGVWLIVSATRSRKRAYGKNSQHQNGVRKTAVLRNGMALFEGLTGFGGVKVFALSMLAFAKREETRDEIVSRLDRVPPQLPWHKNDTDALPPPLPDLEPAPAPTLKTLPRPFKPTSEMTAKQLIAWGEKTHSQPLAKHPVQMHAFTLLDWINRGESGIAVDNPSLSKGKPARGVFAYQLEEAYILMCAEVMWWKPLRWEGSNGVGEHVRRLTKKKKGYRYTIIDGIERRLCFYPVPAPGSTRRAAKRTPEPTPKRKPRKQSKRARQPARKAA